MTREEAIEILKAHHMWTGEPQEIIDVRKENEALEMAIQALEKENIYDDKEHYVTISKALYDKLNIDYEALCEKCEVGNPCLYCKHEFEPQESEDEE